MRTSLLAALTGTLVVAGCGFRVEGLTCSEDPDCPSGHCSEGVCLVSGPDTGPDVGLAVTDAGSAGEDAAQPSPDAGSAGPDAAQPGPDATQPGPDAGQPDAGAVNRPPKLSPTVPARVLEGTATRLEAGAVDPDGDRVTVTWTVLSPGEYLTVTPTGETLFLAPKVDDDTTFDLQVTACDPLGLCAQATRSLVVDRPPRFTQAAQVDPSPAAPGKTIEVTVFAEDPGDTLTYSWTQLLGAGTTTLPAPGPSASVQFAAPAGGDQTLTFSVKACGVLPLCATQLFSVVVQDPNAAFGAYVSRAVGSDDTATNNGTRALPWKTVGRGILAAKAEGLPQVFVDADTYAEDVTMEAGVAVECGWNRATWTRTAIVPTVLQASRPEGLTFPSGHHARLDGCVVRPNPLAAVTSGPITAVTVTDASATLVQCTLDPTTGAPVAQTRGLSIVASYTTTPASLVLSGRLGAGNGTGSRVGVLTNGFSRTELWGVEVGDPALQAATTGLGAQAKDSSTLELHACVVNPGEAATQTTGIAALGLATVTVDSCEVRGGRAKNTVAVSAEGGSTLTLRGSIVDGGDAIATAVGVLLQGGGARVLEGNWSISGGRGGASYGIKVLGGTAQISANLAVDGGGGVAGNTTGIAFHGGSGSVTGNLLVRGSGQALALRPAASTALSIYPANDVNAAPLVIADNLAIDGGDATTTSTGVDLKGTARLTVRGNLVFGGRGATSWAFIDRQVVDGNGQTAASTALTLDANVLLGGDATDATITGGLRLEGTAGALTNNRVWGGSGPAAYALHGNLGACDVFNNAFLAGGRGGKSTLAYAAYLQGGASNVSVRWHNNILDAGRVAGGRWALFESGPFTATSFRNNVFYPDPAVGYVLLHGSGGKDLGSVAELNLLSPGYSDNLWANPLFVDEAKGDLHLQAASPCRNAGLAVKDGAAAADMDGEQRPATGPTDVGPDEAW